MTQKIRDLDKNLILLFLIITFLFIAIYHKFIFGGFNYVTVWDACHHFLPYYAAVGREIRNGHIPEWSFQIGIGGNFTTDSYTEIFKLLSAIIYNDKVLIYIELIKVYLIGMFSFAYFRKLNFPSKICIYGAVSYSFCGMMIVRAAWYSYSSEMLYFVFMVYACELFFQYKKKLLLIISIVLFFGAYGFYQVVLGSIFLLAYTLVRHYVVGGYNLGKCLWESIKIYFISLLLSAAFLMPTIISTINAGRFSSLAKKVNFAKWLPEKDRVLAVVCGFLSESLTGACNSSSFQIDGLDGPLFYVGIINIFLIMLGIKSANKKIKRVALIGMTIFALYLFCPNVTYLYNLGISNSYYKLFVVWIAMFLVVLACLGLNHILYNTEQVDHASVIYGCFVLVSIIAFFTFIDEYCKEHIVKDIAIYCIVLFLLYTTIFLYIHKVHHKILLLLCCLSIEYIFMSIPTIDQFARDSDIFTHGYYYHELENIVEEMYSGNEFFRIDFKGERAESLKYNFYSTSYWTSWMGNSYVDFLVNTTRNYVDLINRGDGAVNDPLVEQLLGVRYTIKPKGAKEYSNYSFHQSYELYNSFYNPYAYDLVTVFNKYMYEEEYNKKNINQKQLSLLDTLIVGNESQIENLEHSIGEENLVSEKVYPRLNTWAEMLNITETDYEFNVSKNADLQFIFDKSYSGNYSISFVMTGNDASDVQLLYKMGEEEIPVGKVAVSENGESNIFNIEEDEIDCFLIRINNSGTYKINGLDVNVQDIYSQPKVINNSPLSNFELQLLENNHVSGVLHAEVGGKALISIPCEKGWSLYVDGIKTSIEKVDFGLMAFDCNTGNHTVELIYKRPGLRIGIFISWITLIVYGGYNLYRIRKVNRKDREQNSSNVNNI